MGDIHKSFIINAHQNSETCALVIEIMLFMYVILKCVQFGLNNCKGFISPFFFKCRTIFSSVLFLSHRTESVECNLCFVVSGFTLHYLILSYLCLASLYIILYYHILACNSTFSYKPLSRRVNDL